MINMAATLFICFVGNVALSGATILSCTDEFVRPALRISCTYEHDEGNVALSLEVPDVEGGSLVTAITCKSPTECQQNLPSHYFDEPASNTTTIVFSVLEARLGLYRITDMTSGEYRDLRLDPQTTGLAVPVSSTPPASPPPPQDFRSECSRTTTSLLLVAVIAALWLTCF